MASENNILKRALDARTTVPAFNIMYLPMMESVVKALRDTNTFGMIAVARPDWTKFEAGGPTPVAEQYRKVKDESVTWLHLDHVPVIDEDNLLVNYMDLINEALDAGYQSVMVDGSRLSLEENIDATRQVVEAAHARGVFVEAELGAVMGHEEGPLPPYEELFTSGKGFTDPEEAHQFVTESGVDWLSVAIGSVHGAVSKARKDEKKVEARLSMERLAQLREATGLPLVLHGGSGIRRECLHDGIAGGIAKVNVATAIRQPYEKALPESLDAALQAVYDATVDIVTNELAVAGSAEALTADA